MTLDEWMQTDCKILKIIKIIIEEIKTQFSITKIFNINTHYKHIQTPYNKDDK